jgi:hypothetical protein
MNYDDLDKQDLQELIEWPCQDFHGGRMPFLGDPLCRHAECHPLNNERKYPPLDKIIDAEKGEL